MADPHCFESLALKPELLQAAAELGFARMTPVQAEALPAALAGRDVLARARTGSGKTAAFALGLLNRLDPAVFRVQALVLCPTRELADQVAKEIRRLARVIGNVKVLSVCGGMPIGPQIGSLQHGAHVVVGTPGRVLKHLRKASLAVRDVHTLVLDEADRMLDMGFADEIDEILGLVPAQRQTMLFSATYPEAIAEISARVQRDPVQVDVAEHEAPPSITQYWAAVSRDDRQPCLLAALRAYGGRLNLVFCNTKVDCIAVEQFLTASGVAAVALHGDLDQVQRTRALVRFVNASVNVLIATDVAARGLDVKNLDAVFNYELPRQPEVYVHRIGRTARAGEAGVALSLVSGRETPRLQEITGLQPEVEVRKIDLDAPASGRRLPRPEVVTLEINGGRRDKLRAGDLLGALTASGGLDGRAIGKIDLFDNHCFVAVQNRFVDQALSQLNQHRIKGKPFKARVLSR